MLGLFMLPFSGCDESGIDKMVMFKEHELRWHDMRQRDIGTSVGRNAMLIYVGEQNLTDTFSIELSRLLDLEDSLMKAHLNQN